MAGSADPRHTLYNLHLSFCRMMVFSFMKKLLYALLGLLLMSSASAQTITPPTIAARAWLLLDASSQQVLTSHEADARIEPASLTKSETADASTLEPTSRRRWVTVSSSEAEPSTWSDRIAAAMS